MPWKAQTCPFCQKKYVNKTGLRNHLAWYAGEWRIPADGVHDVLRINQILHPRDDPDRQNEYQCPSCAKIIDSRRRFMEHVLYRRHYGAYGDGHGSGDSGSTSTTTTDTGKRKRGKQSSWVLPFDEELVKIHQREGPFPFLRLPFDLRQLIYKELFHYTQITIQNVARPMIAESQRHGVWLQHNPPNNPLALLAVSRQTYEEGRRVFYGLNTFIFETMDCIPVFLIGIGQHNAMLLRSVKWGRWIGKYQDWTEPLRPFLVPVAVGQEESDDSRGGEEEEEEEEKDNDDDTMPPESTIWNDEDTYLNLLKLLAAHPPSALYAGDRNRLLRFEDAGDPLSGDFRERHTMSVTYWRNTGMETIMRKGVVSYELLERKRRRNRLPWSVISSYEHYKTRQQEYMASAST